MRANWNFRFLTTLFLLLSITISRAENNPLKVVEYKLPNGLTVWLNEDHHQPKIYGAVVVRAGGVDCPGTGIAHYLEHLLFKGTDKIGTIDYEKEKPYLDSISNKYKELSLTKDEGRRNEIQKEINRISLRAAEYTIPNEFDNLIATYGGTHLNAATTFDYTYYYNEFSPQFIHQWLQINSDRLIHPVFRLFQGELEAVYEEKNRRFDNIIGGLEEYVQPEVFPNSPYGASLIGTTENLKNPRLDEMTEFFNRYYVANNMALILCGDFNADSIKAVIENTFGRLRQGELPIREKINQQDYNGKEVKVKIPYPIVKAQGYFFKAPLAGDKDEQAINVALEMLYNDDETGLLNNLVTNRKMMAAGATKFTLAKASLMGFGFVPSLPFGSKKKANQLCWKQIDRLKSGDFSDEFFESCKRNRIKIMESELENVTSRGEKMVDVYGNEFRDWNDYLKDVDQIKSLTKEDIIKVANEYFNQNYLKLDKKYGNYPKDKVSQPGYKPIKSNNSGRQSEYAQQLAKMSVLEQSPRLLNFDTDASHKEIRPLVNLYCVDNPYNDIFHLDIIYNVGKNNKPVYGEVADYLNKLGTDSLSLEQLKSAFHNLGATMNFDCDDETFTIQLRGYEKDLQKVLALAHNFMLHAKGNAKKIKDIASMKSLEQRATSKIGEEMISILLSKLKYGDNSPYLKQLSTSEIKSLKSKELLDYFEDIQKNEITIAYSGKKPIEEVATEIEQNFPIQNAKNAYIDKTRKMIEHTIPTLYIYDMPKSRQNIVISWTSMKPITNQRDRAIATIFSNYYGAGMNSLVFQEIREFRSLAYSAQGGIILSSERHSDQPNSLYAIAGTQSDKTMSVLEVLDSLNKTMPLRESMFLSNKNISLAKINNYYPSFRYLPSTIGNANVHGYKQDPRAKIAELLPSITLEDLKSFYDKYIKDQPTCIVLIGNKKTMDLEKLRKYGEIVEWKQKDVIH